MMDIPYLDLDELLIECNNRNLSDASNNDITETLKQAVRDKLNDVGKNVVETPQQAQLTARKNPQQETAKGSKELQQLKQILVDQEDDPVQEDQVLQVILSRLNHVMGRLARLAGSPSVKDEMSELIKAMDHIRSLVRDILKNTTITRGNQPTGAHYPSRVEEHMQLDQVYLDSERESMSSNDFIPKSDITTVYLSQRPSQQLSTNRSIQPEMPGMSSVSNNEPRSVTFQEPKPIICWNCGIGGHAFYECGTPIMHVFCFGCGAKDTYKTECLRCRNRQGNYQSQLRRIRGLSLALSKIHLRRSIVHEDEASNTDPEFYQLADGEAIPQII